MGQDEVPGMAMHVTTMFRRVPKDQWPPKILGALLLGHHHVGATPPLHDAFGLRDHSTLLVWTERRCRSGGTGPWVAGSPWSKSPLTESMADWLCRPKPLSPIST